jgi:glyoxylase-like metal-dependent hydrolase (beta-lactamase superfamily II)
MIALGEFRIDRAVEYEGPFIRPDEFFLGYDAAATHGHDWLGPILDPATGQMRLSFHSFVLRTGRHTILIDTCMGNDKERPARPIGHHRDTDFLARLAAAGVQPEEVDFVMCTHLHWDHVGWNTRLQDGRWVPTFPRARYIMARSEYDHRSAMHARGERGMHDLAFADSILPLVHAEQALVVDDDHAIEDGIWLEPCPGHTPGTVVVNLKSGEARGVFSGDVIHSPLQFIRPDWSSIACADPAQSAASRRRLMEQHADTQTLIMPAHFLAPSVGYIRRHGDAFAFAHSHE